MNKTKKKIKQKQFITNKKKEKQKSNIPQFNKTKALYG